MYKSQTATKFTASGTGTGTASEGLSKAAENAKKHIGN